jgi:hypothetical protein
MTRLSGQDSMSYPESLGPHRWHRLTSPLVVVKLGMRPEHNVCGRR